VTLPGLIPRQPGRSDLNGQNRGAVIYVETLHNCSSIPSRVRQSLVFDRLFPSSNFSTSTVKNVGRQATCRCHSQHSTPTEESQGPFYA